MEEDKDIYVSNGKRAIWQLLIAAALYTASVYLVYMFVVRYQANIDKNYKGLASLLEIGIFCFAGAVSFSRVVDYRFNLKEKEYRIIYNFGLVKLGRTYAFKSIDYVAVYYNNSKEVFEVNLWYNKNKHFAMAHYYDAENALIAGDSLAKKLEIDTWDASDPHNGKWL